MPTSFLRRKGAEQAAKELGVKLLRDGPTEPDPAKQNEIVETWITRGVDVIGRFRRKSRGPFDRSSESQGKRH